MFIPKHITIEHMMSFLQLAPTMVEIEPVQHSLYTLMTKLFIHQMYTGGDYLHPDSTWNVQQQHIQQSMD